MKTNELKNKNEKTTKKLVDAILKAEDFMLWDAKNYGEVDIYAARDYQTAWRLLRNHLILIDSDMSPELAVILYR